MDHLAVGVVVVAAAAATLVVVVVVVVVETVVVAAVTFLARFVGTDGVTQHAQHAHLPAPLSRCEIKQCRIIPSPKNPLY